MKNNKHQSIAKQSCILIDRFNVVVIIEKIMKMFIIFFWDHMFFKYELNRLVVLCTYIQTNINQQLNLNIMTYQYYHDSCDECLGYQ